MTRVSVIVPAYQAEATLAATLQSVLGQTHRDLEVIVVDDGSHDTTRAVAERFAAFDPRLFVLGQANAGVAAARNLAIEQAAGEFIAPIDADDLWHPAKLERQLACFAQCGPETGLVYGWFRTIDGSDRVRPASPMPRVEGYCFLRHLAYNFIGNGSSPLIRRSALGELRYDPGLALADAGGCEDYLLQLQLARNWEFALVPAFLTGYRKAGITMSSDIGRMIRSHLAVIELVTRDLDPSARPLVARRIARLEVEYLRNRLQRGRPAAAAGALFSALRRDPLRLPRSIAEEGVAMVREFGKARRGRPFGEYAVDEADGDWPYKLERPMARIERFDRAMAERLAAAVR